MRNANGCPPALNFGLKIDLGPAWAIRFRRGTNFIYEGGVQMDLKPKKEIKHRAAKKMFEIVVRELELDDNLSDRTVMIADNMALLEQMKQQHIEDIRIRGVVELFKNGTQEIYRQNKSVDAVIKIIEHQRKLQAELKLTPASDRKVSGVVEPEGGESGDAFTTF
ncbi:hypothetical protein D3C74_208040 [compost metagenome]